MCLDGVSRSNEGQLTGRDINVSLSPTVVQQPTLRSTDRSSSVGNVLAPALYLATNQTYKCSKPLRRLSDHFRHGIATVGIRGRFTKIFCKVIIKCCFILRHYLLRGFWLPPQLSQTNLRVRLLPMAHLSSLPALSRG